MTGYDWGLLSWGLVIGGLLSLVGYWTYREIRSAMFPTAVAPAKPARTQKEMTDAALLAVLNGEVIGLRKEIERLEKRLDIIERVQR